MRKLFITFRLRQIIRADERCLQFLEALGRDGVENIPTQANRDRVLSKCHLRLPCKAKYSKASYLHARNLNYLSSNFRRCTFAQARPKEFPYADPVKCAERLLPLADHPELCLQCNWEHAYTHRERDRYCR